MEIYDYYECVSEDLRDELPEWFESHDINGYAGIDELSRDIRDYFETEDSVTGYGSNSYTMNRWVAEECLYHNMGLFLEAVGEYGPGCLEYACRGAEACDVLVRCHVLGQVAGDVAREYVAKNYPGLGM